MIALLAVVLAFATGAAPAIASPSDTLGVYAGSGDNAGIARFEQRLGRRIAYAHDFIDKRSWATMNDLAWVTQRARDAGFQNRVVLTVPMLPDTGGTLAQGAAGQYNAHFRKLAEQLVARGHPSAVLRIGPEFNGFWFPWTMNVPNGGTLYAAYWRQIVATMRAVPGANFAFDWCPNAGSSWVDGAQQLDAAAAWPGDDVVDYVGLDVYDQSWSPDRADPAARWDEFVNQKNGMAWHAAFAAAHGKPMTFPEWGLVERTDGMGGGDNPYFIEQMHRWIERHRVAYHLYFESHDPNAEYAIFSGRFPNAAARFVQLFGAQAEARGAGAAARSRPNGRERPGSALGLPDPAKLGIERARIVRSERRLEILAPISRLASGAATVVLHAAGKTTQFTAPVDSARGQVLIRKRISLRQARTGTGIVTISYRGDADTQPQEVRLRAAPRKADLALTPPRIAGGRLLAAGTISRRARGFVRTQLTYTVGGRHLTRQYSAPIRRGRWRLAVPLARPVLDELGRRQGSLRANALFTGYLPAGIGGEMRSFEVRGG